MIKTVIIDDEELIREGLSLIIEWEKMGFEISGVADNGYDGYKTIIETKAELAIVDIMIPDMTGIELAELLKKNNVNCKIIFLTACADFEYAKKSIELDVCFYLLKPLEESELTEKLHAISDMIKKERHKSDMTKEIVLQKLVYGNNEVIEGIQNHHFGSINMNWDNYRLIVLQEDRMEQSDFNHVSGLSELIHSIEASFKDSYVFKIDGLLGVLTHNITEIQIFRIFTSLQKDIFAKHNYFPYIYVGDVIKELDNIKNIYSIIKKFMHTRFLYSYKKHVRCSNNELKKISNKVSMPSLNLPDLFDAIYAKNENKINKIVDDYKSYHINNQSTEEFIKLNYYNLYKEILILIKNRIPEVLEEWKEETDILSQLTKISSFQELNGFIKYKFLLMSEKVALLVPDTPIKKIIDYIDRNYDQNIKIEKIAEIMHYSCSYVGKMIKEELGESFNSYLNRKRIEKSKELLLHTSKISEVAEKVGYQNTNLFYIYFKKITDYTPMEFRKAHMTKEKEAQ
jgi:two-component system, response regulator YesN